MLFIGVLSLIAVDFIYSHSWVFKIDGINDARGGIQGTDETKQRFFCPGQDLASCQPDPKHGVVLDESNLRPCRSVEQANKPTVAPGGTIRIDWMGNGHANSQSDGTCVHIMSTPFALDPDYSDFTHLAGAECLPYVHSNGETMAEVTIPQNAANGKLTLLWYWPFGPFTFSSCMDVIVEGGNNNPVTTTTTTTTTNAPATTTTTTSEPFPNWEFSLDVYTHFYDYLGCTMMPSGFCSIAFGGNKHCDVAVRDACNRSICSGVPISHSCPFNSNGNPTTTVPATTTTSPNDSTLYKANGCSNLSDPHGFCKSHMNSMNTYCRSFQKDQCDRSVCHGDSFDNLSAC